MNTPRTLSIATAILALIAALSLSPRTGGVAFATTTHTFTVDSTADYGCTGGTGGPGTFTLRCAITMANSEPANDANLIKFAIKSCPGVCKIQVLQQPEPPLTANLTTIDGYTEPGAKPNTIQLRKAGGDNARLLIQLDGLKLPGSDGLTIEGSRDTVRGLSITNFRQSFVSGSGGGAGILIVPSHSTELVPLTTGNSVVGNFIGMLPDGNKQGPNYIGVAIGGEIFSSQQVGYGDTIGSAAPADRNLISANTGYGIDLNNSTANLIQGNFIGTERTASGPVANGIGIYMVGEGLTAFQSPPNGSGDTIGGTATGAGNIISGNARWGIYTAAAQITSSKIVPHSAPGSPNRNGVIEANYIGTNGRGIGAIANVAGGISLNGSFDFIVGDRSAPGAANVISGNGGDGVQLNGRGGGNRVAGNRIGLSATGAKLPNKGNGVNLFGATSHNASTNSDTVAMNVIAGNALMGIQVGRANQDNLHDIITQNSMVANVGGGIGLFGQPPDQCIFGAYGLLGLANDYMGCPLIKSATPQTGVTGEACANCTVEVFLAPDGTDNEGKTLLGVVQASDCPHALQPSCWGTWTLTPGNFKVPLTTGQFVTSTATSQTTTSEAKTLELPATTPPTPFAIETSQFSRDAPVGKQLIVNTTADKSTPCASSAYSLRCAIGGANADKAGDEIDFNIPISTDSNCSVGSHGHCRFPITTALPAVQSPSTRINGYTETGAQSDSNGLLQGDNAQIVLALVGTGSPTPGDALNLQGPWDDVEGFSIQNFSDPNAGAGIHISGKNAVWDMALGNWVGLDPSGQASASNQNQQGIQLDGGAGHGLVGFRALGDANALSGNANYGFLNEEGGNTCETGNPHVYLVCNNVVFGNFIGTDPTGIRAHPNGVSGIFLYGSHHNVVGSPGGQLGNIIGGNLSDGIDAITSNFNWITGNNIGNRVDGNGPVGNGVAGIFLYGGQNNLVGGPNPFFLNAVGGNGGDGIDALAEPNIAIWNNIVGSSTTGIISAPNGGDGVFVGNTTSLATPALRKHHVPARVIARTGSPIVGYNTMQGFVSQNAIKGNGLDGIQVGQAADDKDLHIAMNQNAMGGNATAGIAFTGSSLYACSGLSSKSPNDGIPCPYIGSASSGGQQAVISGYACRGCIVEVYRSTNEHGGYGEGQQYLQAYPIANPVIANANDGSWSLELDTPGPIVNPGDYVTATATTPFGGNLLPETSEFAYSLQVQNSCNPNTQTC